MADSMWVLYPRIWSKARTFGTGRERVGGKPESTEKNLRNKARVGGKPENPEKNLRNKARVGGKPENPEKNLRNKARTNNRLNPHKG